MPRRTQQTVRLTAQTVMGNGPTAVSEFKNGIGHRVELENRYGSLAHREFKSLPLRHRPRTTLIAWQLAAAAAEASHGHLLCTGKPGGSHLYQALDGQRRRSTILDGADSPPSRIGGRFHVVLDPSHHRSGQPVRAVVWVLVWIWV